MRLFILSLLAVLLTVPSRAQLAAGNNKCANVSAGGTTFTLTGVTVSAGSAIWLYFGVTQGPCSSASYTITDGGSNAYTQIGSNASTTYSCSAQFYAKNATAFASGAIAIDTPQGGAARVCYQEIQGADQTAPLASSADSGGTEITSTPATVLAITATTDEFIVAGINNYYGSTHTAGNSFTIPANGTDSGVAEEYRIVTAGSYTPRFDITGSVWITMAAASFKSASGSPGGTVKRRMIQ